MQDYPKMLVKGDASNYKIADDEAQETELRKDGYLSHDELTKPKAKTTSKAKTNDTTGTGN